jgi:hypothetical protein
MRRTKQIYQRWCDQCGELHETVHWRARKCDKCKTEKKDKNRLIRLFGFNGIPT